MPILFKLRNLKDFIDTNSVFTSSLTSDRCVVIVALFVSETNSCLGMSEKRGHFFSKYADHVIAIAYSRKSDMVHFWEDGIAQSLFSKFTAYQSLESTCICLIGRKLYFFSDMPIQLAATNRLHHRLPCSLNNKYWLSIYQITTKNIYCRQKCQNMREICDMLTLLKYAKNAAKCQICSNHIFAFFWHAYLFVERDMEPC